MFKENLLLNTFQNASTSIHLIQLNKFLKTEHLGKLIELEDLSDLGLKSSDLGLNFFCSDLLV